MELCVSGTKISCRQCGTDVIGDLVVPPSPVPHLYRTVQVPTESEVSIIRDHISNANVLLRALDAELLFLRKLAKRNAKTLQKIHKTIATHNTYLSPSRRLPNEILTEIFWMCCNGSFRRTAAPTVLTNICSSWRTIVLNTPKLWSHVTIDDSVGAWGQSRLKKWILRSANASMTVSVGSPYRPNESFSSMLQVLVGESERWKTLSFHDRNDDGAIATLQSIKGRLPRLESLYLSIDSRKFEQLDYFSDTPNLRRVEFHSLQANTSHFIRKLQAPHLTHVTITFQSDTHCLLSLVTLQLSPNLIYLYIEFMRCNNAQDSLSRTDTAISNMVVLQPLQTLHMTFPEYSFSDPSRLLDFLEAPNLRYTSFDYRPKYDRRKPCWLTQPSFLSFLRHSSHSLARLEIHAYIDPFYNPPLTKEFQTNITEILRVTPSLKTFKVTDARNWITDQVMMDLTMVDSSGSHHPSVVPMLENLELGDESINADLFASMVGFRCSLEDTDTCRRLRTVNVHLRQHPFALSEIPEAWSNRFAGYRQQGLQISVVANCPDRRLEKVL